MIIFAPFKRVIRTPKDNGRSQASGAARNIQPAAVAVDLVAVMDPLNIDGATLADFDWRARTAAPIRLGGDRPQFAASPPRLAQAIFDVGVS